MITILSEQISQNTNALNNFLEYYLLNRSVKLWLIALLIVLAGFLFKGVLGNFLAKLVSRIKISNRVLGTENEKQFKKVLSWILPLVACKVAVTYVLKAGSTLDSIINVLLSSCLIILALFIVELICRTLFSFCTKKILRNFQ